MTAKKKILFIMNPISGTVRKTGIPKVVEDNLDKDCFDFDLEETRYSGHAYELATAAMLMNLRLTQKSMDMMLLWLLAATEPLMRWHVPSCILTLRWALFLAAPATDLHVI